MYQKLFENWRSFQKVIKEDVMQSEEYGGSFDEMRQKIKEAGDSVWIFFDTETTGLKPDKDYAQVTQVAAIAVDVKNFDAEPEILEEFNVKVSIGQRTKGMMAWEKKKGPDFEREAAAKIKASREAGVDVPVDPETLSSLGVSKVKRVKPPSKYSMYRPISANLAMTGYGVSPNPEKARRKAFLAATEKAEEEGTEGPSFDTFEAPETAEYNSSEEVIDAFTEFLDKYENRVLVAQNAQFDVNYMNEMYRRVGKPAPNDIVVDTVKIFRKFLTPALKKFQSDIGAGEELDPKDAKILKALTTPGGKLTVSLGKLIKAFDVENKGWHDALADVHMLLLCLKAIINFLDTRQELKSLPPDAAVYSKSGKPSDIP